MGGRTSRFYASDPTCPTSTGTRIQRRIQRTHQRSTVYGGRPCQATKQWDLSVSYGRWYPRTSCGRTRRVWTKMVRSPQPVDRPERIRSSRPGHDPCRTSDHSMRHATKRRQRSIVSSLVIHLVVAVLLCFHDGFVTRSIPVATAFFGGSIAPRLPVPWNSCPLRRQSRWQQPLAFLAVDVDAATATTIAVPTQKPKPPYITPYQLLHPATFPILWDETDTPPRNGYECTKSLYSVLHLYHDCLTAIAIPTGDTRRPHLERVLHHAATVTNATSTHIVRLEHVVSAAAGGCSTKSLDPLAWLRAQWPRVDSSVPLYYFHTQERTLDVAVIGSSYTMDYSTSPWNVEVPYHSNWYGGARFDASAGSGTASEETNEWHAFGAATWMLPAVEFLTTSTTPQSGTATTTTLAMHLVRHGTETWSDAAHRLLPLVQSLTGRMAASIPPTTLPPILSRNDSVTTRSRHNAPPRDAQELYEAAMVSALAAVTPPGGSSLEKVVLARRQTWNLGAPLCVLDVIRRWKYGGHEGGHLLYLRPAGTKQSTDTTATTHELFGCTPERLFRVQAVGCQNASSHGRFVVSSEALAGTRPRGSTQEEDESLLQDLLTSPKDRRENRLTGEFIERTFDDMHAKGWVTAWNDQGTNNANVNSEVAEAESPLPATTLGSLEPTPFGSLTDGTKVPMSGGPSGVFVRRLLHVQHICQRYAAELQPSNTTVMDLSRHLLDTLHPTPAICGVPTREAQEFIRAHESISFDRGFYSGPFGYLGRRGSDVVVAIRSALATTPVDGNTVLSGYAGSGVVEGSTLEGEWAETNYKFAVISSLFPQSPLSLRSVPTPNAAWATAFIAELVRNGITRFYVCPGSRSTPLVVAIAKAVRSNLGVIHAVSVHDERAAGFRALGYARGSGKPAAVITSSGTAVSNLYPAIVEAGIDGVPMILLTADRPYESRASGANQAIDQVKTFSDTYIRWFRDVLPPSDDVPVSVALSDAGHAVYLARQLRGPVHMNLQFRENLAPDPGLIRSDSRIGSIIKFDGLRFTDVPGFDRWSKSGGKWSTAYVTSNLHGSLDASRDIAKLIARSKRGIIVVGNLRPTTDETDKGDQGTMAQVISDFAKSIGFPILAGSQSAGLRFTSAAVVLFADHVVKCRAVFDNVKPDLIIQIGAPLVSTAVQGLIAEACKDSSAQVSHVLVHPHVPQERADPSFTVTHAVSTDIILFLREVSDLLSSTGRTNACCSQLAPLVQLGRMVQTVMKNVIFDVSETTTKNLPTNLTEPQIIVALSESIAKRKQDIALFLSNSMPVRDAESFLYPFTASDDILAGPSSVGTNRGASGIDGIISSALGFCESTEVATTLVIGDMAALHDVGSFHCLADSPQNQAHGRKRDPLTTVVVNNNGGGIFSFLPIAKYGKEVSFEEYFGTPTSAFSFDKGAEAFGLPFRRASSYDAFYSQYNLALDQPNNSILEAQVVSRDMNVLVHNKISQQVDGFVSDILTRKQHHELPVRLPIRKYSHGVNVTKSLTASKTMVLVHGWMGDKFEWDETAAMLNERFGRDWTIISIDLPGHGGSPLAFSSEVQAVQSALRGTGDTGDEDGGVYSIDAMAASVLDSLSIHHGVQKIDALVGYSAGGRVALAMKRLCITTPLHQLIRPETAMVLLSAFPGDFQDSEAVKSSYSNDRIRLTTDDNLAREIVSLCEKATLSSSRSEAMALMDGFLSRWYQSPMWGTLDFELPKYYTMIEKRSRHLLRRGRDIALVLSQSSPPRNKNFDWRFCSKETTLFVAGSLDVKYRAIGREMSRRLKCRYFEVEDSGHALLTENSARIAELIGDFLDRSSGLVDADASSIDLPSNEPQGTNLTVEVEREGVPVPLWATTVDSVDTIDSLEFVPFSVDLVDVERKEKRVSGIGWGLQSKLSESNVQSRREGIIVQIVCVNGLEAGLGEISPLPGLHQETMAQARAEVELIQGALLRADKGTLPQFDAQGILAMEGSLRLLIDNLAILAGLPRFVPSVYSGLEMALLSLAAQKSSFPIHQALGNKADGEKAKTRPSSQLALNGLMTRGPPRGQNPSSVLGVQSFPSFKVKVGHQDMSQDCAAMTSGFRRVEMYHGRLEGRLRADANRAWNESQLIAFTSSLEGLDVNAFEKIEFIEEPLQKVTTETSGWTLDSQVAALERTYFQTTIPYALDESLADLAYEFAWNFEDMKAVLERTFENGSRGCASFILKPSLIGLELSLQLARFARQKIGIGAVFSSSFDSGLGLAHTAFLGHVSDQIESKAKTYPHGLGTFTMLGGDVLSPSFGSYVNSDGFLNIPSLSRALYGLSLDELQDFSKRDTALPRTDKTTSADSDAYEASSTKSSSGSEISVAVSLPLPFSAETAWSRFTDLPSMSRWSPWISSVRYLGSETEWTINVRGIPLTWKATSQLISDPFPGIEWQSVSGLNNRGIVEFVFDESLTYPKDSCTMQVRMTIVTPRVLRPLFQGTSLFLEEFLRDKLLKWSLEMFRDVVKADLALERGDVELGDALISSVEGRANAIEATLNSQPLKQD